MKTRTNSIILKGESFNNNIFKLQTNPFSSANREEEGIFLIPAITNLEKIPKNPSDLLQLIENQNTNFLKISNTSSSFQVIKHRYVRLAPNQMKFVQFQQNLPQTVNPKEKFHGDLKLFPAKISRLPRHQLSEFAILILLRPTVINFRGKT